MTDDQLIKWALAILAFVGPIVGYFARVSIEWRIKRDLADQNAQHQREIEQLKARFQAVSEEVKFLNGKHTFAFTKQYEKEFSVYIELWRIVVELYSAALALRPFMGYMNPETESVDRKNRFDRFYMHRTALRQIVLFNRPFIDGTVFELANKLEDMCLDEAIDAADQNPHEKSRERYRMSEETRVKILAASDVVRDGIRKRLVDVEGATDIAAKPINAKPNQ